MKCKVLQAVRQYGMLQSGHVLVALSGGADSMSLLHVLLSMRDTMGFSVEAAHVNHGLRGAESDADEAFVRRECDRLGVPLHVLYADVYGEAAKTGEGLEECGRRIRYAFFASVARGEIATAHTADDNAETVLLHFARGAGLQGLCGIAPVRGAVIRPLILCTRADVEAYCAQNAIAFVHDSSNDSDKYARNRVRRHVMPVLRQINPAVSDAAARCSASLREDAAYLREQTDALLHEANRQFGYDARVLCNAHPALRSRAVLRILSDWMQAYPDAKDVCAVECLLSSGGKVQTERNVTVCVHGGILYRDRPPRYAWRADVCDGTAALPVGVAKIQIVDAKNIQNVHKRDLADYLCCDTIHDDVFFRSCLPGDCMTRVNSGCRKSVKKLLEERRVPAPYRSDIPILTDGTRVLWAYGIGCDEVFAVRPSSLRVMRIQIEWGGEPWNRTLNM